MNFVFSHKRLWSVISVGVLTMGYLLVANALSETDIVFPVKELGSCESKNDCLIYCNKLENITSCLSFAKKYNLMSEEDLAEAEKFTSVSSGPGDCDTRETCFDYCEAIDHIDECLIFAEKHEVIAGEEIEEARRVYKARKDGVAFPGNCNSKRECEAYCGDPNNIEECFAFAEKVGFLNEEERTEIRKMLTLIKEGKTPGNCKSKEQCEAYCFEEVHFEECARFALDAGLAKPEELEIMKKVLRDGGPGGCKSREVCESYCNNPDNMEECLKFASDNGLVPKEEVEYMREGMVKFREVASQIPPEVRACLEEALGEDGLSKMERGEYMPGPEIGMKMQECFKDFSGGVGGEEGHSGEGSPRQMQLPPNVLSCVKERLGEDTANAITTGKYGMGVDPTKIESAVRACFEENSGTSGGEHREGGGDFPSTGDLMPPRDFKPPTGTFSFPPDVAVCVDEAYGTGTAAKIQSGEMSSPPDMTTKIQECMQRKFGEGSSMPVQTSPPPESQYQPLPPPPPPPDGEHSGGTSWILRQFRKMGASLINLFR